MFLEIWVCLCAELQVFFLQQRLKESMSGDAPDYNIETRAVIDIFFSARQRAEENSRPSGRNIRGTCTVVTTV
jgi:hypothetical protein